MADNNRITFTAFLQDDFTKNFDAIAARSNASIRQLSRNLTSLSGTGRTVALSIDDIDRRLTLLQRVRRMSIDTGAISSATAEIKRLEEEKKKLEGETGGGGTGGGAGKLAIVGAAVAGAYKIAEMGKDFVKSSAQAYMNYESITESFKVLAKSDSIGAGLAARLNKFQQDTILGPEVFKGAQTLLSFGISVSEVEKDLRQLGDISGGNTEKFNSLTLAFAQTRSAGRLMGQDLLQYINAGFNPLQTMAERWKDFGFKQKVTVGQLKDLMEKGKISADMVARAFELATSKGGLFDGMLDKMGKTTFGMQKQLEGGYESLKIAFGERMRGEITSTLGILNDMVLTVKRWVEIPASEKTQAEIDKLRGMQIELTSANTSQARRKQLLDEMGKDYPQVLDGIDKEAIKYDKLAGNIDKVTIALNNKKIAQKIDEDNGDLLDTFNNAKTQIDELKMETAKIMGQINDPRLLNPALSFGNKETLAQQILQQRFDNGKQQPGDDLRLSRLRQNVTLGNQDVDMVNYNLPKISAVNKQKADANKIYNDAFGLNDDGSPKPKKGDGTGTGGIGKSDASISGGTKIQNLIINIDALVKGGVNIHATTVSESSAKAKQIIVDALLTAVNDANLAAGK